MEYTLFSQLPYEIRAYIYEFLPKKDLLQMRLVSHQVKIEVEENTEFSIKIDDQSCRFCHKLMNLRVSVCTITNFTHQISRKVLFKYSNRIRRLVFDGGITPMNLNRILGDCSKVEELSFTHEALGNENLLKSQKLRKYLEGFNNLTNLNLQFLRYPLGDPFSTDTNITFFLDTTFQHLQSFKFYYSVWGNWADLFLFLMRHVTTLNSIELQVGDRGDSSNTANYLREHDHTLLRNIIDITILRKLSFIEFRFRDDVLHVNPTVKNIIFDILSQQKTLEILHFHSPGDMTVTTLSRLVQGNEKTLKELVVYNLQSFRPITNNNILEAEHHPQPQPERGGTLTEVDMRIFSKCSKMTVLALSCAPMPANNPNLHDTVPIHMVHMNSIPQALETFHLTGFKFISKDIVDLSHNLPNLRELLVMDAGKMKYSRILTNILKNCPRLEYLNVSPLKTRGSSSESWWFEVRELNKLYQRFMNIHYDPIDDLDGFEAHVSDMDREWIKDNMELHF